CPRVRGLRCSLVVPTRCVSASRPRNRRTVHPRRPQLCACARPPGRGKTDASPRTRGMDMRARRAAAALLAVAALGIGAVGCGDDDDSGDAGTPAATTAAPGTTAAPPAGGGDATAGKEVFAANCSGCHTLSDAGATWAAGPNTDDLKPDDAPVQNT